MPARHTDIADLPRPALLDRDASHVSAWRGSRGWRVLDQPTARIVVSGDDAAGLHALPSRVASAMAGTPGAVARGLVSYEAGRLLHGEGCGHAPEVPAAVVHIYDGNGGPSDPAPSQPRRSAGPGANGSGLVTGSEPSRRDRRSCDKGEAFRLTEGFRADISRDEYQAAIARIQEYLRAGDCYQINYAQRFSAHCEGDSRAAWLALLAAHPAPHACYLDWGDGQVFGVSPERFLRIQGRQIASEPIKGSMPRGGNAETDDRLAQELLASAKDRAENLMIVDLLRNDLGRVCRPGSIRAEPLFELRRFSNVHHLVSTVTGELRPEVSALEALLACFPGGSITGAPKKRAMQIIAELEPTPRDFYCGCFFELDQDGNLDSSILIRTLQRRGRVLLCHGGGGITHDSDAALEYAESLFKVERLMESVAQA